MHDELVRMEARLHQLEQAVVTLNRRVRSLEGGRVPREDEVLRPVQPIDDAALHVRETSDLSVVLTLVGRTFMVFGGAFLLRALTDSGKLPRGIGIALGLAYATAWFVRADLALGRERRLSGIFHAVSAVAIAYPLLWEASTRFGFLAPPASAVALAVLTGLAFAVAWHRRMEMLAGLALLGAMATTLALVRVTGQFLPFSLLLTLIGVATLWLGYDRDWFWLRWPAALVADVTVTAMAMPGVSAASAQQPAAVIGVQLFLLAAYAGSVAARTLLRRRVVVPFEVVQTLAALAVGLGGAVAVAHASGAGESEIAIASTILGIGAYAAALACWRSRADIGANFYFYAVLALVLTLTGGGVLLHGDALALALAPLAVLTAWLAIRYAQPALVIPSAAYCVVAAAASGLLTLVLSALALTPNAASLSLDAAGWVTLAASAACIVLPRAQSATVPFAVAVAPRVVLAALATLGACGVVVAGVLPVISGATPDTGVLATLRTAVLASAVVMLAAASRSPRTLELGWLLYPLLAIGGLKLAIEDFRYSEPATLFLALGLFGAALVATARLVRRKPVAVEAEAVGV